MGFCCLYQSIIFFVPTVTQDELLGEVDLSDYNVCDFDEKKKTIFKIANSEEEEIRPYVISASNEREATEWIEAFREMFKVLFLYFFFFFLVKEQYI